ncbi:transposase [Mycetohabitans rhizoxinica]|uniref:Transposase n=2 Tax=Mycetohabitans rhizoxinica TaxID=412963 RepID=E5APJ8_MYCRK|nr:transposase [Mycetohabitans sp. B2]MCG1046653.1 transposase [Mycetohabitans sp. B6]CBW74530.1 Transposase [Mycetohabitans rhizoxinica HKI 454]
MIQPGKPAQNVFIESLNSKFSDERVNKHGFTSLVRARAAVAV